MRFKRRTLPCTNYKYVYCTWIWNEGKTNGGLQTSVTPANIDNPIIIRNILNLSPNDKKKIRKIKEFVSLPQTQTDYTQYLSQIGSVTLRLFNGLQRYKGLENQSL